MVIAGGEKIQGGPFDGFKLVAQSEFGVISATVNVYTADDRFVGYIPDVALEDFKAGDSIALRPVENWRHTYSKALMEKLGLSVSERQPAAEQSMQEDDVASFMISTDDLDSHFRYKIEGMGFLELIDLWEKGVGDLHVDLSHPEKYEGEIVVVTSRPGFESEFSQLREDLAHSIVPVQKPAGQRM